jgi:hypothetical protein
MRRMAKSITMLNAIQTILKLVSIYVEGRREPTRISTYSSVSCHD